ncbi:MAG: hypothetical protein WCG36_06700 [bacterium]
MRRSATIFMQLNGAITGWNRAFSWMGISRRGADTVGNMLDFRRVGGAGARIASTVVSRHAIHQPERAHAPCRPA